MNSSIALRCALVALTGLLLGGCSGGDDAPASSTPGAVAAAGPQPGEQTYNRFCFSCHAAGVAGAPKVGDVESWAPRIAKGQALLLQSTIAGIPPGMPPRGLCGSCSDADLADAVTYMVDRSR